MMLLIARLLIIFTSFALLADSFGSNQTIYSYFGISSTTLLLFTWFVLILIKHAKKIFFEKQKDYLLIKVGFIVASISTIILSVWDYLTPANYVYSITRIQQQQLGLFSLFLGGLLFLYKNKSWWQLYFKRILLLSPFIALFILLIVRMWPMDYFLQIVKEDHLIENLQVYFLLFGSVNLSYQIIKYRKKLNNFTLFLMLICVVVFTFLAGEEISWGQRIFGFSTAGYMAENNLQNETTVHNLSFIQWMVEVAYAVIGLAGGTLWLLRKTKINLSFHNNWFIPANYLFAFFIFPGIYYAYPLYSGENLIKEWAEIMELFLYAGVVLHAITLIKITKQKNQPKYLFSK